VVQAPNDKQQINPMSDRPGILMASNRQHGSRKGSTDCREFLSEMSFPWRRNWRGVQPPKLRQQDESPKWIGAAEVVTVVTLVALCLLFARPELETWGVFATMRDHGFFGSLEIYYAGAPSRLLEPFPLGMAWLIGGGAAWAVGVVYAAIIIAKYAITRWAVIPIARGPKTWVLATVGAVMLPWAFHWRGHNLAQQLSSAFLLIAVGTTLRLRSRFSLRLALLGTGAVLFSLLTYEALIVCAIAIPLLAGVKAEKPAVAILRACWSVYPGCAAFVILFFVAQQTATAAASYHSILSHGDAYPRPLKALGTVYWTIFVECPWTLTLAGIGAGLIACSAPTRQLRLMSLFGIGVILLPLLAAPYAVNLYFLSDTERVGLPAGFGFFLLLTGVAAFCYEIMPLIASVVVGTILLGTTINAYQTYQPYRLQRSLIDQLKQILREHPAPTIIARDWSGKFGDRYTFVNKEVLPAALKAESVVISAVLCTPPGVDRVHPAMNRLGSPSQLPRCDSLPIIPGARINVDIRNLPGDSLGLPIATWANNAIPDGPEAQVTSGSLQREGSFWWINETRAAITIQNNSDTPNTMTVRGALEPPPCPEKKPIVRLTVDGKVQEFEVARRTPFEFTTDVQEHGSTVADLSTAANPCRISGDSRSFYFGVIDISVK
jgi:hypothetical protein